MNQDRFKRVILYGTAGVALLLALVALFLIVEQRRTQAETGAVLSAFFSQVVLRDMDKWDAGRTITIVVMRNPYSDPWLGTTSPSWFAQPLKSRWSLASEVWFAQSSKMTRASFFLNRVFSSNLSTDL